jgi:hypothetical protein
MLSVLYVKMGEKAKALTIRSGTSPRDVQRFSGFFSD